eukprot:m.596782 g.596782  ORF g.596782 m.596782 type:complete len:243 (-) comp22415_c0_seq7:203-931(-)
MGVYWELIPKPIAVAYLGQLVGTLVSQPCFVPLLRYTKEVAEGIAAYTWQCEYELRVSRPLPPICCGDKSYHLESPNLCFGVDDMSCCARAHSTEQHRCAHDRLCCACGGVQAGDASSTAVRSAVFKGLTYLLDNHLCRPVLREALPRVAEMIHDPCATVRRALLDLLVTVKTIRTIKFWEVVPVAHLLARLEIEAPDNAKRIVELLCVPPWCTPRLFILCTCVYASVRWSMFVCVSGGLCT